MKGTEVEHVDVIPLSEKRARFAQWAISQEPPLSKRTHQAYSVPLDLLSSVPDDLLTGALVDGHAFRPVLEGFEPDGDGYKPAAAEVPTAAKKTTARKRVASRKEG